MRVRPLVRSNSKLLRTSIVSLRWARPIAAWAAFDSQIGAPISRLMTSAISSLRRAKTPMILPSSARRSSRLVCDQAGKAARAAATALSTSADEPSAMSANFSSVAGLMRSQLRSAAGFTHFPPI